MKILLLGKDGQLGWELQRSLATRGELISLNRKGNDGWCGDLGNLNQMRDTIRKLRPDVVVNAAAYTLVDKAEDQIDEAFLINSQAPKMLAEEVKALGGWLVHYSTDYVFNGSGTKPWVETDFPEPLNQYGLSKLHGEQAIQDVDCKHLIFRTSWVYGSNGNNFAKSMIRLAKQHRQMRVVGDQFGAPTGAELLADVTSFALASIQSNEELSGIYHLAALGYTSWHEYACFVIEQARAAGEMLEVEHIEKIATQDYPTPAARPLNSRLQTTKLESSFNVTLPQWQDGVSRMIQEIIRV